jgi:SPP1 gp7 family putative phage head morphogenesis protein
MADLAGAFNLEPERALAFFRAKGYVTSFAWQDVFAAEHRVGFTVAKMLDLDLLRDVRMAVDRAIESGLTKQQFADELEPRLVQAGWWGRQEVDDPKTGETKLAELGSPSRLELIFRTNLQTSYSAGHWSEIQDTKADAPYLLYEAVDDDRTREEHRAWDGTVLPVDDAWWMTHMPPNGWNCRCGVVQLSAGQVKEHGFSVADKAPPSPTYDYTNPRTGVVSQVPKGIDPGWAYNPGEDRQTNLDAQYTSRLEAFRDGR